ncbi:hypothetical protein [Evtepia sp.]|uniref:hypothetical protein n=1 Tax=Evtepia sp. TaxID=2773933 RepID=UPI003F15D5F5
MKRIIAGYLQDDSDQGQFRFSLTCVECGTVWKSPPIRFSKAGVPSPTEAKQIVFRTLYQREWEQARERAIVEAAHGFNWCPLCGRLVCNRCFLICDDLDMCRTCAEDLHERGDPVA